MTRKHVLSCLLKMDSTHHFFTRSELNRHIKIKHGMLIDG